MLFLVPVKEFLGFMVFLVGGEPGFGVLGNERGARER